VLNHRGPWSFGRVGPVLCSGFEIQGYQTYVMSDKVKSSTLTVLQSRVKIYSITYSFTQTSEIALFYLIKRVLGYPFLLQIYTLSDTVRHLPELETLQNGVFGWSRGRQYGGSICKVVHTSLGISFDRPAIRTKTVVSDGSYHGKRDGQRCQISRSLDRRSAHFFALLLTG